MQELAAKKELDGCVFNLQAPSYLPLIMFADDRGLREQIYQAYVTRASETGPDAGKWDNAETIDRILELRREKAALLGFDDYVEYALQTRMANNGEQIAEFLSQLAAAAKPAGEREFIELSAFASQEGITELQAWDIPYYSEKLRQQQYDISQEEVRPWFPLDRVLEGMFGVVSRLYGLTIVERSDVDAWHPDVRYFEITDADERPRGRFFLDLFARKGKRGGAWMGDGISRKAINDRVQNPLAWLVTNFTPPVDGKPSLLTHDEVTTLFHEFGHGLHHMLTRVDYPSVAGINGVPWDAVELPSQIMENWCWEDTVIEMISGHYETGEPLPAEMIGRLKAAKNFQAGMLLLRQLEFALFDMAIHHGTVSVNVQQVLDDIRKEIAAFIPPPFNRFQNSFSHIFAGGYASGYYSYSWAEVLSADAYSLFEEKGIFDRETGQSFLHNVLEKGGSREPLELFIAFRGREPEIDALLRHRGLAA
jgi:oligopeptidase A